MYCIFALFLPIRMKMKRIHFLYTKLQPSNMPLGVNSDNLMHTFVGKSYLNLVKMFHRCRVTQNVYLNFRQVQFFAVFLNN